MIEYGIIVHITVDVRFLHNALAYQNTKEEDGK